MTVKSKRFEESGVFFCTFTCYKWLNLFEISNLYDHIYNWFRILTLKNNQILGFVIMPNHIHLLIYLHSESQSLDKLIGNGKRFMAYEIVKQLSNTNNQEILNILSQGISIKEALKGKRHEVFEDSFDVKVCYNENVVRQKLDYLHLNPVRGKWQLTTDWKKYEHSSAGFYFETKSYNFEMTHFKNAGVNEWFPASNSAESLTGDSAGK